MTTKHQAALRRDEKSAAILASTAQLIARRGSASAQLWRIARDAGVTERAIIAIFGSKDGILRQLCVQHMSVLLSAIEKADLPGETRRARLDTLAIALISAIAEHAHAQTTVLLWQDRLPLSERRDMRQRQRWIVALFSEAFEAVVPALRSHPDLSRPAVMSLMAMLNQHGLWFRDDGPMRREAYARFAVTAVLGAVRHEVRMAAHKRVP